MKTLKVTIENLQQVKNGVVCGTQVAFRVIQAGRVLVERGISGKTSVPFTLSYDVSADDEPLVVEHDRPDLPHLQLSASFSPQEYVSYLGMALCRVIIVGEGDERTPPQQNITSLKRE
ncbi:hypothetical protein ACMYSK_09100 [Klebsiella sp. I138]|uniref:hypothetical protein n=1 Tax=Klebsiella sp. I138 TaxID=2755385 RepID=UPI003DAA2E67